MPIIRQNIGILALLAATSIGAFNTLLYWSLQHTTAINATLMQSTGPLLIGLWSFALFREPLTRRQIGGICISLVGIVAVVSGGRPGPDRATFAQCRRHRGHRRDCYLWASLDAAPQTAADDGASRSQQSPSVWAQ